MLIQCIDERHVRLGFRADPTSPWVMSKPFDVMPVTGHPIGEFAMQCWSTVTGGMYSGAPGGPMYQKFLVDYIHYRYGLSQ